MTQSLANAVSATGSPNAGAQPRSRHGFFVGMSVLLLATVLVGFAPSFYLKTYFETPPLPVHLHLHGVVLSTWFLLFFLQTSLVASGRTDLHRRFGIAGAVLAATVVIVSIVVTIRSIPRLTLSGASLDQIVLTVSNSIPAVIVFSLLVLCGLSFRRRPETHKRLMLLSCISIIGPAVSRLPGVRESPAMNPVVLFSLLLALILHDIVVNKRVHPATLWGELLIVLSLVFSAVIFLSSVGPALVRLLGSVSV